MLCFSACSAHVLQRDIYKLPAPGLKIRLDADKEISSSMILIWILVSSYYLSRRDVSIRMTSQVVPAQIREGRVSSRKSVE